MTRASGDVQPKYPNAWVPEISGECLEGTVVEVTRAWSDWRSGFYPLLQIDVGEGVLRAFHAFSTVAYNEIMEKQPVPGEQIKVIYTGISEKGKEGQNPAKLFRVLLPSRDPAVTARSVYSQMESRSSSQDSLPGD
jgi:hypothetical protein